MHVGVASSQDVVLTIKGWAPGQSPEFACKGEPTTNLQDLVRETGIQDIEVPVVSCSVKIDSVAGVAITESARLLFMRGALVRVSIDLGWLELESLAAIRGTLLNTYGKPITRRSNPFITDKWTRSSSYIELERTDRLPSKTGLYLTENRGWTEYQRLMKQVDDRLEAQKRLSRKGDLKD
jgi:hypothetical protein